MVTGNYVSLTSVWNLLSHKYRDVLMGLNGSKSMLTFFSFPSSVTMVPQYITKPLGGTTKIQTNIKSKTLQMIQIKHLKQILTYRHICIHPEYIFNTCSYESKFENRLNYKLINTNRDRH